MLHRAFPLPFLGLLRCGVALSLVLAGHAALPTAHRVAMARPIVQPNAYACGPTALTMLLGTQGPAVEVDAVSAVVRLHSNGTAIGDIVRGGVFSAQSSAPMRDTGKPIAPMAGYPGRPLGLACLAHAQATPWLDEVKALIAADIPVLMLMQFTPQSAGGHYRIAMGYDEATQTMWFADPWGRELKGEQDAAGFQPFSYTDVCTCWTFTGYGTSVPHWGMILIPWTVRVQSAAEGTRRRITADIAYPCPAPFAATQLPTTGADATLDVPAGWTVQSATTVGLGANGAFPAGSTATVSWLVAPGSVPATVRVTARGQIRGELPATGAYDGTAGKGQIMPGYAYRDAIGGSGSVTIGAAN